MNAPASYPLRAGGMTLATLFDLYMAQYTGRDGALPQRLDWWRMHVGQLTLAEVNDDHLHAALETLKGQNARYYAGKDANGQPIFRARNKPLSGATINRYASAIASPLSWAIRRRIAPKGFDHPVRRLEHNPEVANKTRFLNDDERARVLAACRDSKWPKLYLLVLMALTTGARKGDLLSLRWQDIDSARKVAHVARTKIGEQKLLPLVPAVIEEVEKLRGAPSALVFCSRLSNTTPMAFEERWKQTLKVAKIRGFRFHDLRHSCASYLAQSGATLLEIADVLGHRQLQTTKRYAHLAVGHRSALVERVLGGLK
jgi:integrase